MHGRCVLNARMTLTRRLAMSLMLIALSTIASAKSFEAPPDSVAVKVGRTISVMFTQAEGRLITPNPLPDPVDGESVLTLKLTQNGPACTLYVTNGFAKTLNYKTFVRYRGSGSFVESVAVPVRAYREGVMSFAARVEEIILYEFRLSD
jgi:hypothetical protein